MSVFTITMLNIARAWHLANISCAHMQANKNLVRYCGKKLCYIAQNVAFLFTIILFWL